MSKYVVKYIEGAEVRFVKMRWCELNGTKPEENKSPFFSTGVDLSTMMGDSYVFSAEDAEAVLERARYYHARVLSWYQERIDSSNLDADKRHWTCYKQREEASVLVIDQISAE